MIFELNVRNDISVIKWFIGRVNIFFFWFEIYIFVLNMYMYYVYYIYCLFLFIFFICYKCFLIILIYKRMNKS